MKRKIIIGNWEATWLLVNAICAKIYLNFPRYSAETAGTAGWIMSIYVWILALIGFAIISKLYSRFEGKDLMDIGEIVAGSAGRIITGLIVLSFLLYIVPLVLREFAEDLKIISLPISPISYVIIFLIIGMVSAAYFGLESITRTAGIVAFIIAIGYIIILIANYPYYDLNNIMPILGNGVKDIFAKGALRISIFSEFIYIFLLAPYLKSYKHFKKVGYWALFASGISFVIGSLLYILAFHYTSGLESFLPVYQMAKLVSFGKFFQRVESLFLITWAAAALVYISGGFFFIVYTFKKTFKLEYYKPLILPFTAIVFMLSMLPQNLVSTIMLDTVYFRNWSWIVTFGFTILLLVIARFIRNKNIQGDN